ncbi:MAG: selenocysteine-specific translation elongation factor [Gemmataceae bacterium]
MPRDLILGTAGHIDHGKTSLVEALTGVNCDRLPEEKQRGITIDIGFAALTLGDHRLGIVDVPGHERFVKNMLAGATGIDLALLVVAADDSIMPQTREHLEILSLLGLRHGCVAITKADLVDETTREVVSLEVRELVAGTFLENAPIVPVSSKTGLGIDQLKTHLLEACNQIVERSGTERFRLAIDRSFVVQGHGTVVTGSVASGSVRVGDELDWHKGDGTTETVRVRGLNNHGETATEIHRGQRAAINLAGISHTDVRRGQELATAGTLKPSRVVTVRLHALPTARHPMRHRLPCRLHIGTAEVMATLSVLDADRVEPGQWAIAQLFLNDPVTAVWGQPFVIRDSSAEHTLGGGQILQPTAYKLRRRHTDSLVRLESLWSNDVPTRAAAAVWFAGYGGIEPDDLVRMAGVEPDAVAKTVQDFVAAKTVVEMTAAGNRVRLVHADRVAELEAQILTALGRLHTEFPLLTTHDRGKVTALLHFIGDDAAISSAIDRMLKSKSLVGDARRIARADFKPKLSINQRKLKDRIVADHVTAGFAPPDAASFVNLAAGNAKALGDIYEVAVAEGLLVKVSPDLFISTEIDAEMRKRVTERLSTGTGATMAEIRDLLGTTRKYAVPFCEYLDRIGVTKRNGDLRVLNG